ncbi:hypothetical protein S83_036116, partial [Arachis hypogaea]
KRKSSKLLFCSRISPFSWISMEGLFGSTLTNKEKQKIDLTLKLSSCVQIKEKKWMKRSSSTSSIIYIEENERKEKDPFVPWLERTWSMPSETVMMKCRDMHRAAKILLLHEQNRRGAAAPSVLPSSAHVISRVKKLLATPNGDSRHE